MAGRHRKTSRPGAVVGMVVAPGALAAAAMAATSMTGGAIPTDTTTTAGSPLVDLLALITPANSTSQFFAGTSYYGTDWTEVYGTQQVVPFLLGPQGIADEISSHQDDVEPTGVTASGWGAGQTGTALGILAENNPGALDNVGLVILDNNTNRAGGGFWTTYAPFAPLLLTSAEPTPTDLPDGVTVLDVGYEYNINGNAPVDPLNPFTLGNSLAAYAFGYGAEGTALDITQEGDDVILDQADGPDVTLEPGKHYVVRDGNIVETYDAGTAESNPSTIYVTVDSGDLPLTRGLRLFPGGDILADALDPTLTELVDAGYADGKGTANNPAIPTDPTVTRPMQPGSSLGNLGGVPATIPAGLGAGVDTAQDDLSDPTKFVTKPIDELGNLPVLGSLTNSLSPTSTLSTTGGSNVLTSLNKPGITSSPGSVKPGQNFSDRINEAVKKVTGGLQGDKPADTPEPE